MSNALLEKTGEFLIKRVRDKAIGDWERYLAGQAKGLSAERVRQQLSSFSPEQKQALLQLIPQIVDSTLHHLLWSLDQEHSFNLMVEAEKGLLKNVREASDGLPGELYGNSGWIAKFSSKAKSSV